MLITIYMHTLNGKSYIGQTCQKLSERTGRSFQNYKECPAFYNAIQKYGHENVVTEIFCQCNTQAEANYKEAWYIEKFNTIAPKGYNLQTGGSNGKPSLESRQKMSGSQKGRKHTPETIEKMSKAQKGVPKSLEHREKLRGPRTPWGTNNPMSAEKRKNMRRIADTNGSFRKDVHNNVDFICERYLLGESTEELASMFFV